MGQGDQALAYLAPVRGIRSHARDYDVQSLHSVLQQESAEEQTGLVDSREVLGTRLFLAGCLDLLSGGQDWGRPVGLELLRESGGGPVRVPRIELPVAVQSAGTVSRFRTPTQVFS